MSKTDDSHAPAIEAQDHGGHGGHEVSEPLGPVDLTAWAYALGGAVLGALVVVALYLAGGS